MSPHYRNDVKGCARINVLKIWPLEDGKSASLVKDAVRQLLENDMFLESEPDKNVSPISLLDKNGKIHFLQGVKTNFASKIMEKTIKMVLFEKLWSVGREFPNHADLQNVPLATIGLVACAVSALHH